MDERAILAVFLVALGVERLAELATSRVHLRRLVRLGARFHGPDGLVGLAIVQVALFVLVPLEFALAPWGGVHAGTWALLALALAAQGLRYWVIATLGDRWSVRVVTLPNAPRIVRGPYRFLRHPNYVAVALEMLVISAAFGAFSTAILLSIANALALRRRLQVEERALATLPPAGPSSGIAR